MCIFCQATQTVHDPEGESKQSKTTHTMSGYSWGWIYENAENANTQWGYFFAFSLILLFMMNVYSEVIIIVI